MKEIIDRYFEGLYKYRNVILSKEYPKEVLEELKANCGEDIPFYYAKGHFWNIYNFNEEYFLSNFGNPLAFYLPIVHFISLLKKNKRQGRVLLKDDPSYVEELMKRDLVKPVDKLHMQPFYFPEKYFSCYKRENWKVRCARNPIPLKLKIENLIGITPFALEIYKIFGNMEQNIWFLIQGLEEKGIVFLYFRDREKEKLNELIRIIEKEYTWIKVGKQRTYIEGIVNTYSNFINNKVGEKFENTKIYFNPFKKWFKGKELVKLE